MTSHRSMMAGLTSILGATLLAQTANAAIPTQYRLTDLGTLGGAESYAEALNNATPVQVTGNSFLSDNTSRRGFIYTAGGSMVSVDLGPNVSTFGNGINDDGDVVGTADTGAFVYRNGVAALLPQLSATFDSWQVAFGISNSGLITGWSYAPSLPDTPSHAFRYSLADNSIIDLGTAGGLSSYSEGLAINNFGQVAGNVQDAGGSLQHAMFYDGAALDIDSPGSPYSYAYDLNDQAQVVGAVTIPLGGGNFDDRAFLYDYNNTGSMALLPALAGSTWSEARGINNLGQVVGLSLSGFDAHAVLWSDNQLIDLNARLEPSALTPYVVLSRAEDINENGWILVNGYDTRTWANHAYLLEPLWP
jgi:probable HAF family extracellular repeat protein